MTQEVSDYRVLTSSVTFHHAFTLEGTLAGDDMTIPAGTFVTHTCEAIYAGDFHTSYVAVSVDIEVHDRPGRTSYRAVEPSVLAAALARDHAKTQVAGS